MATVDDYLIKIQLQIQNDKQLAAMTRQLERTGKVAPQAQRQLTRASSGLQSFGRSAQNASFQLTDFIVQVQSGQAASRAFAQQAPQLLAGFGALGAALGVVAAVLPSVIQGFTGGAGAAQDLDKQIERLAENTQALAETVDRVDFSSWVKDFNDLDQQARTLARSILELRTQAAEIEFEAAVESFSSFVDVIVPGTKLADIQLASIANNLGLSVGALEQLIPLITEFRQDPFGDPQNLEEIVRLLEQAGVEALPLLNRLNDLKAAQEALNEARETGGAAARAGAGGVISTGEEELRQVTPFLGLEKEIKNTEIYRAALEETGRVAREFQETQQLLADTSNNNVEVWEASAEVVETVGQSFETAFNGVAMGTQTVSDAFENMAKVVIAQLLKIAAQLAITNIFGPNFLGGAFNPAAAKGAAIEGGKVMPFAKGGVVRGPTVFPMASGMGLMGEAGPEAVLPLRRTSSGNLGVEASPVNVTINNLAPGVQAVPRQDSGGLTIDVVMESISGAIRRGGNDVANALEESYSIGRGRGVY